MLKRSSPRNCKMTFIVGRGFAERQILKKWKWLYLPNWVEYFHKLLRKHWYWQDLAQEIATWHFSLVEALPSSNFRKNDNGSISWTEWNIVMKGCIHIDIDKLYPMRLSNDIWDWLSFCRGSNSEKSEIIAKWHLSSVEALPSAEFWKSENGIISWTEWNVLIDFCVDIDSIKIKPKRLWNVIFHRSRFGRAQNSEKSENSHISWTEWNIVMKFCIHIGILTRCSPWDCQMTFGIGRGFAEIQILKKLKINY